MKYYIGYFKNPRNDNEFTVVAATTNIYDARFIFEQYKATTSLTNPRTYVMLTAEDIMYKTLIF